METLLVLNTGGTFNKRYNPLTGELDVAHDALAIEKILHFFHNTPYKLHNILYKDSLEMHDEDRAVICNYIQNSPYNKVLIVHGTDTKDQTAQYLAQHIQDKTIVITGAMTPFSIDTTEATANFSMGMGFLLSQESCGIYIAMHGAVKEHQQLQKNRQKGVFEIVV